MAAAPPPSPALAGAENTTEEIPPVTPPLEESDLLFIIFTFVCETPASQTGQTQLWMARQVWMARRSLRAVLQTCKCWRAAALRADLPFWGVCNEGKFKALAPPSSAECQHEWTCEAVALLLAAKPRIGALDLSACSVSSAAAALTVSQRLPSTLHTLAVAQRVSQPDAMLQALLRGLAALPQLRRLDLRGILDERTLAGVRLLGKAEGKAAASLAVRMPALEAYSVGFHLHSAVARREGAQLLRAQEALAPRLRYIGALVAVETPHGGLGPVDVCCRGCTAAAASYTAVGTAGGVAAIAASEGVAAASRLAGRPSAGGGGVGDGRRRELHLYQLPTSTLGGSDRGRASGGRRLPQRALHGCRRCRRVRRRGRRRVHRGVRRRVRRGQSRGGGLAAACGL